MVFALLGDFVNLKNLHIQYDGKNPCHRQAAATCTYRRTLGAIYSKPITNYETTIYNNYIALLSELIGTKFFDQTQSSI
jgi:hypothetical protein